MAEREPIATFWTDENGNLRVRVYPAIAGVIITVIVGVLTAIGTF